jgi:type IV pilus assembly protein PilA
MAIGGRITGREAGFTLVELLVVMLVIGILAAIALPAFVNQKSKATDTKAKHLVHTTQVAMETCGTENKGTYPAAACNLAALRKIVPEIPATKVAPAGNTPANGYTITVTSDSENAFKIVRAATGALAYSCTVKTANRGGCPGTGTKAGTWGP